MRPKITNAHLQQTLHFMADPAPYRQLFLEGADALAALLLLLDKKATYAAVERTKNPEVAPSHFGEAVLRFANLDFIASEGALAPRIAQEFDPTAEEALRHFGTHVFLNLIWWYVGPILWAVGLQCPYMPESWVKEFLRQKTSPSFEEQIQYLDGILDFIRSQDASVRSANGHELRWVTPYEEISGQLGEKGRYALRLLIGMLLEALENPVGPKALPPPIADAPDLTGPIAEFLETLDLGQIGKSDEPEEGGAS